MNPWNQLQCTVNHISVHIQNVACCTHDLYFTTIILNSIIIFATAILRLPSILLYECSLLPRAKDSVPHPEAPYPVMFICSSMDKSQSNIRAFDPDEARLVVETANRYLSQWPDCWGKFYADQVCILARTHQQVSTLLNTVQVLLFI